MNKLWCFGDSFTSAHGINFDELNRESSINRYGWKPFDLDDSSTLWTKHDHFKKYKEYKNSYKDSTFGNYLSNHFNLKLINEAESGSSNDRIIHNIFQNLSEFNSEDVIIIGMTSYVRVLIPSGTGLGVAGKIRSRGKKSFVTRGPSWNSDFHKAVTNFCHDVLAVNEDLIEEYYMDLFLKIRKSLLKSVKRVILWDKTLWGDYQSIKEWKGIDDDHWSPEGHKDFANFVIENYEKDNDILCRRYNKKLI